ncbi:MAG: metallophosphoesterase [Chloroflexota bacterium]
MTFHFLLPIYRLVAGLPNAAFFLALPLGLVFTGQLWHKFAPLPATRPWDNWGVRCLLVFGLLDWLLLAALPRLRLSFGPAGAPLAGMIAIRTLVIVLFLAALLAANRLHGEAATRLAGKIPVLLLAAHVLVLACEFEALYFEPFFLRTSNHTLAAPVLFQNPNVTDRGLRIVQLSDTHVERTTRRERELVERIRALKPDIILLTGDYLNLSYLHDPQAQSDARALFSQLQAPYGVYAVTGSVDPASAIGPVFDGLEITFLSDAVRRILLPHGEFYLVGVTNRSFSRDQEAFQRLVKSVPDGAFSVLIYHTPDLVETAAENGMDLVLSGHTHGGQIRLPFYGAVFTNSRYGKTYEMGRYEVGTTTLYVSRGIGMEGNHAPRARFLCPPEIVVFDLLPGDLAPRLPHDR